LKVWKLIWKLAQQDWSGEVWMKVGKGDWKQVLDVEELDDGNTLLK